MHEIKSVLFPGIKAPSVTTVTTPPITTETPMPAAAVAKPEITTIGADIETTGTVTKPEILTTTTTTTPTPTPTPITTATSSADFAASSATSSTTTVETAAVAKKTVPAPLSIDKIEPQYDYAFDFSTFFTKDFDLNNIKIIRKESVHKEGHEGRVRMAEMLLHLQKLALSDPQQLAVLNQTLKRFRIVDKEIPTADQAPTVERNHTYQNNCVVQVNERVCRAEAKLLEMQFPGKVVMLNMANDQEVSGNPFGGARAQEENIARTTDLVISLLKYAHEHEGYFNGKRPCYHRNAFGQTDVLYSRNKVFRTPTFEMEETPFSVNMITSASLIMSEDKKYYDRNGAYSLNVGQAIQATKIYNQIATAIKEGNEAIVLGAFGCGSFLNDAKEMAKLFRSILSLPEFIGKIKVHFAIIQGGNQPNFTIFAKEFTGWPLIELTPDEAAKVRAPIIAIQEFEKITAELTFLINSTQQKDTPLCHLRDKIRIACVENAANTPFIPLLKNNMRHMLSLVCEKLQEKYIHRANMMLDLTVYQSTFPDKNRMVFIISKLIGLIRDSKSGLSFGMCQGK